MSYTLKEMKRKRIRIAYIINRIERGGPGYIVLNLIEEIDKKRFIPVLVTLFDGNDGEIVEKLRQKGIKVIECGFPDKMRFLLADHHCLERFLLQRFDVLHTHGFIPDFAVSRMKGIPMKVTTVHNVMEKDYFFEYGKLRGTVFAYVHRRALRKFDAVAACSRSVWESIKGIPRAAYVRNGINVRETGTAEREWLKIPDDAAVFIYAGRMSQRKNVTELVRLFSKYHGVNDYLIIAGDGTEMNRCRRLSDNHIKYIGYQNNPVQYMKIADVYISASNAEGFSVSVLEALSCGLKLFLSDIDAHREVFEVDKNIYLGEIFDADNFAEKLELLKTHHTGRESIQRFCKEKLSAGVMTAEYQEIYSLGSGQAGRGK